MSQANSPAASASDKTLTASVRTILLVPVVTIIWVLVFDPEILKGPPLHSASVFVSRPLATR